MIERFEIEYKNHIHSFEWNRKEGSVWLIENDEIGSKSNHGQEKPAKSLSEAKIIAELMLYSMGF